MRARPAQRQRPRAARISPEQTFSRIKDLYTRLLQLTRDLDPAAAPASPAQPVSRWTSCTTPTRSPSAARQQPSWRT